MGESTVMPDPVLVSKLMQFKSGIQAAQAVSVMARLSIADILRDGSLPAGEIAARCGADPVALRRLPRNVRQVIAPAACLLAIDLVVRPFGTHDPMTWNDLRMLVMRGERERTREEFFAIFAEAGFVLTGIYPARGMHIVEGRPVGHADSEG